MSFANKHNAGSKFNIDTKGFPYVKLSELSLERVYTLNGFFINSKGNFNPHPVFIVDGTLIDMPEHLTAKCREIEQDTQDILDITAGKVGFKVREYQDKKGVTRRSIEWVDIV